MAININTIKSWFKTGLKPTQAQFWDTWDSFWHKDEPIPISKIEGIQSVYNEINSKSSTGDINRLQTMLDTLNNSLASLQGALDNKANAQHTHEITDINNLQNTLGTITSNIAGIQNLLQSDNVNLDNVQELVDAIETVQLSLSTILVDDLTTGGVTKALTAEQGKVLKDLIDDFGRIEYNNYLSSTNSLEKTDGYLRLKKNIPIVFGNTQNHENGAVFWMRNSTFLTEMDTEWQIMSDKILINKDSDDGKGILQVNGNITANPATEPEQVVTFGQVNTMVSSGYWSPPDNNGLRFGLSFYYTTNNIITLHINGQVEMQPNSILNFTVDFPQYFIGEFGENIYLGAGAAMAINANVSPASYVLLEGSQSTINGVIQSVSGARYAFHMIASFYFQHNPNTIF